MKHTLEVNMGEKISDLIGFNQHTCDFKASHKKTHYAITAQISVTFKEEAFGYEVFQTAF